MSPETPIVTVKERDIAVIHALQRTALDQLPENFTPLQATELIAPLLPEIDPEVIFNIVDNYLDEVSETGVTERDSNGTYSFNSKLPLP